MGPESPRRLTLDDLRRWEDHGATWHAVEVADAAVTVQLCTCFGEPIERATGGGEDLVDYVRSAIGRDDR